MITIYKNYERVKDEISKQSKNELKETYIASLSAEGLPTIGTLMLAVAYCDEKPSEKALNSYAFNHY